MKIRSIGIGIQVVLAVGLVSAWSWSAAATTIDVFKEMHSAAATNTTGIYLSGDAGLAIMQNMVSQGSVIQYHVGPRADASVGYNINPNIAVSLQSGFAINSWSAVNNGSIAPENSVNVRTVPVLVNGIYKYALTDHWQAYGGLGAGAVISTLDMSQPGGPFNFTSTDCTFGYQAMLGIKYSIGDNYEWGVGYSFLGSLDHHWSANNRSLSTTPTYMHTVLVSLTYRF